MILASFEFQEHLTVGFPDMDFNHKPGKEYCIEEIL